MPLQRPQNISLGRVQRFLHELARVKVSELPAVEDQACSICTVPYAQNSPFFPDSFSRLCGHRIQRHCGNCATATDEDGNASIEKETALRLPCQGGHIFGADCLLIWLSIPTQTGDLICPSCRSSLNEDIMSLSEFNLQRVRLHKALKEEAKIRFAKLQEEEKDSQSRHRKGECNCIRLALARQDPENARCRFQHLLPIDESEGEIDEDMEEGEISEGSFDE